MLNFKKVKFLFSALMLSVLIGCTSSGSQLLPDTDSATKNNSSYLIGPGDQLQIFVWRNPDLSTSVTVRPDGRISSPLIDDLDVSNLEPMMVAKLIEDRLSTFIRTPRVSIMVSGFNSTLEQQIRVLGNATNPKTLPYRSGMTLLDVMIAVQGLSDFADGDNAQLIRKVNGETQQCIVELDSLIRDGDISKNRAVQPGDTIIIPEAWF
jgi:polysaccharide export outer membrane protein